MAHWICVKMSVLMNGGTGYHYGFNGSAYEILEMPLYHHHHLNKTNTLSPHFFSMMMTKIFPRQSLQLYYTTKLHITLYIFFYCNLCNFWLTFPLVSLSSDPGRMIWWKELLLLFCTISKPFFHLYLCITILLLINNIIHPKSWFGLVIYCIKAMIIVSI